MEILCTKSFWEMDKTFVSDPMKAFVARVAADGVDGTEMFLPLISGGDSGDHSGVRPGTLRSDASPHGRTGRRCVGRQRLHEGSVARSAAVIATGYLNSTGR